jgi:cephalosporin hydroxylase
MQTLQEIYNKYCTESPVDGGDKGTVHSYIDQYYETALASYRTTALRVLEIGINQGHSLMMWKEYFPHAEVIGVDIKVPSVDTGCLMIEGDATDPNTFKDFNGFDVIIDDGSHVFKHQIKSFNLLFPKLNAGGIYIIEDIRDIDSARDAFLNLHPSTQIFDMRKNKNRPDDVIVQIKK